MLQLVSDNDVYYNEDGDAMETVSKTLFIPLYGKALVSSSRIILDDPDAERIWAEEGFPLKGKAGSKWLAYYMSMRAKTIDLLVLEKLRPDSVILHIGCGLDARAARLKLSQCFYDIDLKEVIAIRRQYFQESESYHMLAGDAAEPEDFLSRISSHRHAVVVMEGLTMYLSKDILTKLFQSLSAHFETVDIILDAYSTFALKAGSKRNPISEVNATASFGFDDPVILNTDTIHHCDSYPLYRQELIAQLSKSEQRFFKMMYTNGFVSKLYQIHTYTKAVQ